MKSPLSSLAVFIMLLTGIAILFAQEKAATKPKADVIFTHGNVFTGVLDPSTLGAGKRAEAIAVRGDRILAVGARDEVEKLKGSETKIVDLEGHFVMPGFNDAHLHLAHAGEEKTNVNLVGAKSLENSANAFSPRSRRRLRQSGSSAAVGMKRSGRCRCCRHAGMWTR
jgi:predicted amidohydrolase YtcJ